MAVASNTAAKSRPVRPEGMNYFDALAAMGAKDQPSLTGIVIERSSARPFHVEGCIGILLCFCVHDSPDSPCPCKGPIVWLPEADIVSREQTSRGGAVGSQKQPLTRFTLQRNAKVLLDRSVKPSDKGRHRFSVIAQSDSGELEPIKGDVWIRDLRVIPVQALVLIVEVLQANDPPGSIALETGNPWVDAAIRAFTFGYAVGTAIDQALGLSDDLSDWLVDHLPEWPW